MDIPYIVAIGSSAGGMVPMQDFFESTPHDAVAYVILRHFLMEQKSQLQHILQKHSRLEIVEITENILIEKDKVYIPASHMYVTLSEQGFHLTPRNAAKPYPNKTVDVFLQSLAWIKGAHTIAVILSGDGTDGMEGIAAIHSAGGLVIAQDPISCEFKSMPECAIRTGMVDKVLLPKDMPKAIAEHVDKDLLVTV
ncbi:MAG: chemotaxis protein CheB [Chitinophagaceae bacterium]|nr:chemotaxis protein CheB [Chitinophagaceae bacterium]